MKSIKIFVLFLCVVVLLNACSNDKDQEFKKPNIVVFLADDQGWGDISFNGNTNVATPNIDKIGNEGASFDSFYVQAVCSPTRSEFLTGRYASRSGVYSTSAGGERIDLDETTIATIFQKAGYATGAFGKWHSGMQFPYHPNARGFEEFYGFCSGHWGSYFDPMLEHNGEIVKGSGFLADDIASKAINFIEENKEQPFLVYVPFNTPHSPMQVPEEYWSKFENKELELKSRPGDKEDETFTKAALAMTENLDWNVGRILQKLKELQLNENTIVLYFTDNGPNGNRWNGEMKGRKGSTDEGGVRSPLFVKWPNKIKKGLKINQISGAIDLLPTLTSLADIEYSTTKKLDGIDLSNALFDIDSEKPNRLIFNYWREKLSVRNQLYRLDNANGLYNMTIDRGQNKDLSEEFPAIKSELLKAKEAYLNTVVGELPEKDLRTFPLGHPEEKITQIPARDGVGHGNIVRSNKYPNSSFYTNWIDIEDSIIWDVEVLESGNFEVMLYYTCAEGDEGSEIELSFGDSKVVTKIEEVFDTPLTGMEHDKIKRIESYVKEFKPLSMGVINLEKGEGQLKLKALKKPGKKVIDVRLLLFKRV
ncbi:arylsulfatase [Urechidicola vernalis]|uniref:Arylsulfatase n=1 Tax=Urechidicola vernalis TaxID=3075600 RepID=A0ABU2Y3T0_9FLAO|nr:arylsulfatase [Urechidicola sp. P050]MDT0552864.1 arylsulfatase [Urechidicola sp. P050]